MIPIADIIRARLRTVGVEEHHFIVEKGGDAGSDVYITDVGGSRSQVSNSNLYLNKISKVFLFIYILAFFSASFLGSVLRWR